MGFPVAYTELLLPKLLLHTLTLLTFLRSLTNLLFTFLGLDDTNPDHNPNSNNNNNNNNNIPCSDPPHLSITALLIRESLPISKFSDLLNPPESCAVCLFDFNHDDEIRPLANCVHIFHRSCLDRWMGYDQKTCPLCRSPFVSYDLQEGFNQRLWSASGLADFYDDDFGHLEDL